MKVLVFGATGPSGREIVAQALRRGDSVTAFARRSEDLGLAHERLRTVQGDAARDAAAIADAVRGQDAVLSALGRRATLKSEGLIERSMALIVPAMERAGVHRLVIMSAFGVGESARAAPLLPRLMYRVLLTDIFADKLAGEARVRASALEWTIAYPVLLTNGPLTGRYRAAERLDLRGLPKISRADVAHFILAEAQDCAFVRKIVALSY